MIVPREGSERQVPASGAGEGSIAVQPAGRLSDYTIIEPIGSGLRGTVYRARSRPGRLVALKVFNPGVEVDLEALRRFSPYSDGGIAHPSLVPIEAAGQSEGKSFCSMPLLHGDSLAGILAELRSEKPLAPHLSPLAPGADGRPRPGFIRNAVSLLLDVAEGLASAHAKGVIHGRLGPRNLILSPAGRLVVTDFGSEDARPDGRRGVSHDLRGLAYRAPEQLEQSMPIDGRTDVYALGAILYELLTLRPPFSGRDPKVIREAIIAGDFPPPSTIEPRVTREAEAVVLRCMALEPDDRYPTALELSEDLRRLLRLEATWAGEQGQGTRAEPYQDATEPAESEPAGSESEGAAASRRVPAEPAPPAAGLEARIAGTAEETFEESEPLPTLSEVLGADRKNGENGGAVEGVLPPADVAAADSAAPAAEVAIPAEPFASTEIHLPTETSAAEDAPEPPPPAAPEPEAPQASEEQALAIPETAGTNGSDSAHQDAAAAEVADVVAADIAPPQEEIATPVNEAAAVASEWTSDANDADEGNSPTEIPAAVPFAAPADASAVPFAAPADASAVPLVMEILPALDGGGTDTEESEPVENAPAPPAAPPEAGVVPEPAVPLEAPADASAVPLEAPADASALAALPSASAAAAHAEAVPAAAPLADQRGSPILTLILIALAIGGWTWFTIDLYESGAKSRARTAVLAGGLERVEGAVFAIFADDASGARDLVSEARRIGAGDPGLEAIETALSTRVADPLASDLAHPRAAIRREAVTGIATAVEAGERPPSDLQRLAAVLEDPDPAVRTAAIDALARAGSSKPLLAAYPIGRDMPALEIDGLTLLALARGLADIGDGAAQEILLGWSFDDFARLDVPAGDGEEATDLPPNLKVFGGGSAEAGFATEWVRGRARLGSVELIAVAKKLSEGDLGLLPIAPALVDALAALETPEATKALADLAAPLSPAHAPRVLSALARLGAWKEILAIARSPLPGGVRAQAAAFAGWAIAGEKRADLSATAEALGELVRRDPDPQVRGAALRALASGPAPWGGAVLAALSDPALRDDALDLLARRPVPETLPVLLDALRTGDGSLRARTAAAIAASKDPSALPPLAVLLHEGDPRVRAAALEAMRAISPHEALALAAGVLPGGCAELRELALEALLRRPPAGIGRPDLFFLAARIAVGLEGGDSAPAALKDARREALRAPLMGASANRPAPLPARLTRMGVGH